MHLGFEHQVAEPILGVARGTSYPTLLTIETPLFSILHKVQASIAYAPHWLLRIEREMHTMHVFFVHTCAEVGGVQISTRPVLYLCHVVL